MDFKKTIWILNHHSTGMAFQHGGRHYYFAKYLIEKGYNVRIFCASVHHGSQEDAVDLQGNISTELIVDGIPFVFVKTRKYRGNGISRVLGMFDYYFNVKKACKQYSRPDVIIGSSVHPLACVAAIHLSKRYSCKNIVEIRDLWPESIVEFMGMSRFNPIIMALYRLEKWIYVQANDLIFTIEGGYQYIKEKKWNNEISEEKVFHINNGVDVEGFKKNIDMHQVDSPELDDPKTFKVIYTGSIRKANNLTLLLSAAKIVQDINDDIRFLIIGDGEDRESLMEESNINGLKNVLFLGKVKKNQVPYVLSNADCNVLNYKPARTWKYGGSQNKLFEYLASGKPIISNVHIGYSLIERYSCGIVADDNNAQAYAQAILNIYNLNKEEYENMCTNATKVACMYDYRILVEKLINVID